MPDEADLAQDTLERAEARRSVRPAPPQPALPSTWTDSIKTTCARHCAAFGDSPCWRLPQLNADVKPEDTHPCGNCLSSAEINQQEKRAQPQRESKA